MENQQGNRVSKDKLDHMAVIDIFRAFDSTGAEYTFLPSARGTFSRIAHMLKYKTRLSKVKMIEIISHLL